MWKMFFLKVLSKSYKAFRIQLRYAYSCVGVRNHIPQLCTLKSNLGTAPCSISPRVHILLFKEAEEAECCQRQKIWLHRFWPYLTQSTLPMHKGKIRQETVLNLILNLKEKLGQFPRLFYLIFFFKREMTRGQYWLKIYSN